MIFFHAPKQWMNHITNQHLQPIYYPLAEYNSNNNNNNNNNMVIFYKEDKKYN